MLAVYRKYTLEDAKHLDAQIQVIPTGLIEIDIPEKKQHHSAEFTQLRFETKGKITHLVGKTYAHGKATQWKLPLDNADANELAFLIKDAEERLEILMRDLT